MKKLVNEYLTYFSSIKVKYPHEDLYPSKKEIDKILSMDDTYLEYEHLDSIKINKLYNLIKKNSTKYVKKHPKFQSPFKLSFQMPESKFMTNVEIQAAIKRILENSKNNSKNDFLEDTCKIKDLKIVLGDLNKNFIDGITTATYLRKKNVLVLNPKAIKKIMKIKKENNSDLMIESVLTHELSHTKTMACNHRIKKGQKFERILGDSTTLIEASAESSLYALDEYGYYDVNHYDFTYSDEREEESLILLLGLFRDNKTYDDYYNAISDSNPEAFYDFCGVKSKEEKYTLYKILAAMDARNGRNDIAFKVKKSDNISLKDANKSIRYNYKLDIFHKVLENMVDYTTSHSDFTIEKNLQMLNIIENCILSDNLYLNKKNTFDQNFIIDVYQSETKYLDFLSQYYFEGEKDSNSIKEDYKEDYIGFETFIECIDDIAYDNTLLDEFPLLRPILFTHDDAFDAHEVFIDENKSFVKKCKIK